MNKPLRAAMNKIPMRGDPIAYRQRISDFENGFREASSAPKTFIVICPDAHAEAISTNTDASLAEARSIISRVRRTTDDEIYRAVTESDKG